MHPDDDDAVPGLTTHGANRAQTAIPTRVESMRTVAMAPRYQGTYGRVTAGAVIEEKVA